MTQRYALCVLAVAGCLVSAVALAAAPQKVRPTGLFSNMHWIEEAGDVIGAEILVVFSLHGGTEGQYWAYVQQAEGVPEAPNLVKATVTGDRIEFTLPDSQGGRFIGHVSAKALVGKFERFYDKLVLPKSRSYWQ